MRFLQQSGDLNSTAIAEARRKAQLIAIQKYLEHLYSQIYLLQWEVLGAYVLMLLLALGLLVYLRRNRQVAFLGDAEAARKIILPSYEPLLWIILAVSGVFTVFFIVCISTDLYDETITKADGEGFAAGRNFIATLVMVFMFQKSLSLPALRRACLLTMLITLYPIPILMYMERNNVSSDDQTTFVYFVRGALAVFYAYIFICPPQRASTRVFREYSIYSLIYLGLVYVYSELFRDNIDLAMKFVLITALWVAIYPVFVWRVLRADTEYWRGLGQRACILQHHLRQKKKLNEHVSAEGLHLLIEMHRKFIIDFAYLNLLKPIGNGSTATVFQGILHNKVNVAVKVYTPVEVTEETVAEFSNEAALCGALQHPNIVTFYGMCVCPPNICLVSELCAAGLDEVLELTAEKVKRNPTRKQMCVNISYMLDASRAVAYLHSFSPAFIHRDIKPANFLVDSYGTVKLTDFGESRVLPGRRNYNESYYQDQDQVSITVEESPVLMDAPQISTPTFERRCTTPTMRTGSRMTVRGTVDYMAPELMSGKGGKASYGEGADIYSLAITMWEILHPDECKYPSNGSHLKVYEWVLEGRRPPLKSDMHPRLRELIESAWSPDVALRPSANNIVHILEEIQEDTQAMLAATLQANLPLHTKRNWKGKAYTNVFSGDEAVVHMIENGYVDCEAEAVRVGNAMMDAGLIHHAKHHHPFENSSSIYYFENQKILECQPLTDSETGKESEVSDVQRPLRKRLSSTHTNVSIYSVMSSLAGSDGCQCRELSQGFSRPKRSKTKPSSRKSSTIKENILTSRLLPEVDESNDFAEF